MKTMYGLTLIEVIVYIAILAALLAVVVNTLLIVGTSYRELRAERLLTSSARDSFERVTRDIRSANSVDVVASVFDASPGTLRLVTSSGTVQFGVGDGVLEVHENSTYQGDLTHEGVTVDALTFRHIDTGSSEAVRIEMALTAVSGSHSESKSYETTVVLRGSYGN